MSGSGTASLTSGFFNAFLYQINKKKYVKNVFEKVYNNKGKKKNRRLQTLWSTPTMCALHK